MAFLHVREGEGCLAALATETHETNSTSSGIQPFFPFP